MTSLRERRWPAELGFRARRLAVIKALGTTAWTWLFFVGYFHTLKHPTHAPFVMPLTALDRAVPFAPEALWFYLSLWVYVGIGPGLQRGLADLLAYGAWSGALLAAGLGCFRLWPTIVPARPVDLGAAPGFAMLQGVDAAGNACPSMHVAIAVFTGAWIAHLLRSIGAPPLLSALNVAWCVVIVWSTLATRQHVALDALAGALLGGAFAGASIAWRPSALSAR